MDDGIRRLSSADADAIASVVNAAARAYEGTIPADCYSEPYLSVPDLRAELETAGFFGYEVDGTGRSGDATESLGGSPEESPDRSLVGVVGFQERDDASLIRRLYVRPEYHGEGIGSKLLDVALDRVGTDPILVGTWRDAEQAVGFYEANGFTDLGTDRDLLRAYWDHSEDRNAESVVLRYDGEA